MKKLLIFLAILILLTIVLVITNILSLEVEAATLSEPPEWDWDTVSSGAAIGIIKDGNKTIYVDTLTHAADVARANVGTQVVLYLEQDYTTELRIGYTANDTSAYDLIDLTNGANLVIDGVNKWSMRSKNGRFIHFDPVASGKETGEITFRNMTIGNAPLDNGSYAAGSMQTNAGSLSKITLKNVTIDIPNPRNDNPPFVVGTDIELDSVICDCYDAVDKVNTRFMHIFGPGQTITVKSTVKNADNSIKYTRITNAASIFYFSPGAEDAAPLKKISVDGMVIEDFTGNVFENCEFEEGEDTGIFVYNLNVSGGPRMFYNITGDIRIDNGTINTTDSIIKCFENNTSYFTGNIVINGGNFTSSKQVVYFNTKNTSTLTINGGTFTSTGVGYAVIQQAQNAGTKMTTINGGTFNSWTKNEAPSESNVQKSGFSLWGVLYSSADTFQVNGGTFNLYNSTGTGIATNGLHAASYGSGYICINGGTFKGGNMVHIMQDSSTDYEDCERVEITPAGGTYTIANSLTTVKGASIRTTDKDNPGIRFQGIVSKNVIDYVKELSGATNVYSGILIVPAEYLKDAGGIFTIDALSGKSLTWATKNATMKDNGDGTYTIRLALIGVKQAKLSDQYVAITYVYGDVNGNNKLDTSDIVVYAKAPSEPRSVVETAQAALADVMTTSGTYGGRKYTNAVTGYYYKKKPDGTFMKVTGGTMPYTPFTAAQTDVIKAILANAS